MRKCRGFGTNLQFQKRRTMGGAFPLKWLHIPADFADYPIAFNAAAPPTSA